MPLYQDVEAQMVARISSGDWGPGTRLPNEFVLADEFGVSQGTLRKALAGLEARGLVTRRPRHGTVVAEQTDEKALFAFFRLRQQDGSMLLPEPGVEEIKKRAATVEEQDVLGSADVWHLTRARQHQGKPFSLERIVLPDTLCPALDSHSPFPNSLYPFLEQTFRISVAQIEEDISAVSAYEEAANVLRVGVGTPLLRALRRSFDLTGRCVELRDSLYLSDNQYYAVTLKR